MRWRLKNHKELLGSGWEKISGGYKPHGPSPYCLTISMFEQVPSHREISEFMVSSHTRLAAKGFFWTADMFTQGHNWRILTEKELFALGWTPSGNKILNPYLDELSQIYIPYSFYHILSHLDESWQQ